MEHVFILQFTSFVKHSTLIEKVCCLEPWIIFDLIILSRPLTGSMNIVISIYRLDVDGIPHINNIGMYFCSFSVKYFI